MPTHPTLRALAALLALALALAACSKTSDAPPASDEAPKAPKAPQALKTPSPQEVCTNVLGDTSDVLNTCVDQLTKAKQQGLKAYDCQAACITAIRGAKAVAECPDRCAKQAAEGDAQLTPKEQKAEQLTGDAIAQALTEDKGYKLFKTTPSEVGTTYHYLVGVKSDTPEAFVITLAPIKSHRLGEMLVDQIAADKAQSAVGFPGNTQAVLIACIGQGKPPTQPCDTSTHLGDVLKAIF